MANDPIVGATYEYGDRRTFRVTELRLRADIEDWIGLQWWRAQEWQPVAWVDTRAWEHFTSRAHRRQDGWAPTPGPAYVPPPPAKFEISNVAMDTVIPPYMMKLAIEIRDLEWEQRFFWRLAGGEHLLQQELLAQSDALTSQIAAYKQCAAGDAQAAEIAKNGFTDGQQMALRPHLLQPQLSPRFCGHSKLCNAEGFCDINCTQDGG